MSQKVYTISEIKEKIVPIAKKYNLSAVYLFGSYARGNADEDSDIDLLIDTTGSCVSTLFELGSLYADLEDVFLKEIDIVTVNSLRQKAHTKSETQFREDVVRERLPVYGTA